MPKDYNAARSQRASSDRGMQIGPFIFTRVVSAEPEVLIGFNRPDDAQLAGSGVDQAVINRFDETILILLEPLAIDTRIPADGVMPREVPAKDAWDYMRHTGDENGVISFSDIGEIVADLLGGVVERPTEQPDGSPTGSETPPTGIASTETSPSEVVPHSILSTLGAPSTPSTPTS